MQAMANESGGAAAKRRIRRASILGEWIDSPPPGSRPDLLADAIAFASRTAAWRQGLEWRQGWSVDAGRLARAAFEILECATLLAVRRPPLATGWCLALLQALPVGCNSAGAGAFEAYAVEPPASAWGAPLDGVALSGARPLGMRLHWQGLCELAAVLARFAESRQGAALLTPEDASVAKHPGAAPSRFRVGPARLAAEAREIADWSAQRRSEAWQLCAQGIAEMRAGSARYAQAPTLFGVVAEFDAALEPGGGGAADSLLAAGDPLVEIGSIARMCSDVAELAASDAPGGQAPPMAYRWPGLARPHEREDHPGDDPFAPRETSDAGLLPLPEPYLAAAGFVSTADLVLSLAAAAGHTLDGGDMRRRDGIEMLSYGFAWLLARSDGRLICWALDAINRAALRAPRAFDVHPALANGALFATQVSAGAVLGQLWRGPAAGAASLLLLGESFAKSIQAAEARRTLLRKEADLAALLAQEAGYAAAAERAQTRAPTWIDPRHATPAAAPGHASAPPPGAAGAPAGVPAGRPTGAAATPTPSARPASAPGGGGVSLIGDELRRESGPAPAPAPVAHAANPWARAPASDDESRAQALREAILASGQLPVGLDPQRWRLPLPPNVNDLEAAVCAFPEMLDLTLAGAARDHASLGERAASEPPEADAWAGAPEGVGWELPDDDYALAMAQEAAAMTPPPGPEAPYARAAAAPAADRWTVEAGWVFWRAIMISLAAEDCQDAKRIALTSAPPAGDVSRLGTVAGSPELAYRIALDDDLALRMINALAQAARRAGSAVERDARACAWLLQEWLRPKAAGGWDRAAIRERLAQRCGPIRDAGDWRSLARRRFGGAA